MFKHLRYGAAGALFLTMATDAAFAGAPATPGPMIGAGAPALALFGIGYWLIRRRRRD
jgi:hypothetical protein